MILKVLLFLCCLTPALVHAQAQESQPAPKGKLLPSGEIVYPGRYIPEELKKKKEESPGNDLLAMRSVFIHIVGDGVLAAQLQSAAVSFLAGQNMMTVTGAQAVQDDNTFQIMGEVSGKEIAKLKKGRRFEFSVLLTVRDQGEEIQSIAFAQIGEGINESAAKEEAVGKMKELLIQKLSELKLRTRPLIEKKDKDAEKEKNSEEKESEQEKVLPNLKETVGSVSVKLPADKQIK